MPSPVAGTVAPSASATPAPSASGPSRPFRPTPTPAPTFATWLVRQGDTLIALARRFETTPESLAYWNRARYPSLDPDSPAYRPDRIEVGWQLTYLPGLVVDPENLPPASGPPTTPGAAASAGPYPTLPASGAAALVVRGPAGGDAVALTFDYAGGPGAGPGGAAAVVQWLVSERHPGHRLRGAGGRERSRGSRGPRPPRRGRLPARRLAHGRPPGPHRRTSRACGRAPGWRRRAAAAARPLHCPVAAIRPGARRGARRSSPRARPAGRGRSGGTWTRATGWPRATAGRSRRTS